MYHLDTFLTQFWQQSACSTSVPTYRVSANKRPAQVKDHAQIIDQGSGELEISRLCLNRRPGLLIELIVCACIKDGRDKWRLPCF